MGTQLEDVTEKLMKESILNNLEKQEIAPPLNNQQAKPDKVNQLQCQMSMLNILRLKKKAATAGKAWFDLPAPEMTDELRRELQIIRLRHHMDPKRHYKRLSEKLPKFFQVRTIPY